MDGFSKKEQQEIKEGSHGYGVKFIYEYNIEMNKLDHSIVEGYDRLYSKFLNIYNGLISSASSSANDNKSNENEK